MFILLAREPQDESNVCRELIRMAYSREDLCKRRTAVALNEKIYIVRTMEMESKQQVQEAYKGKSM